MLQLIIVGIEVDLVSYWILECLKEWLLRTAWIASSPAWRSTSIVIIISSFFIVDLYFICWFFRYFWIYILALPLNLLNLCGHWQIWKDYLSKSPKSPEILCFKTYVEVVVSRNEMPNLKLSRSMVTILWQKVEFYNEILFICLENPKKCIWAA